LGKEQREAAVDALAANIVDELCCDVVGTPFVIAKREQIRSSAGNEKSRRPS
jgi:hypothetical protein